MAGVDGRVRLRCRRGDRRRRRCDARRLVLASEHSSACLGQAQDPQGCARVQSALADARQDGSGKVSISRSPAACLAATTSGSSIGHSRYTSVRCIPTSSTPACCPITFRRAAAVIAVKPLRTRPSSPVPCPPNITPSSRPTRRSTRRCAHRPSEASSPFVRIAIPSPCSTCAASPSTAPSASVRSYSSLTC